MPDLPIPTDLPESYTQQQIEAVKVERERTQKVTNHEDRVAPRTAAGKRLHDDYPGIWFWEWSPRDGGEPFDGPLGPSIEAEAASLDSDELRKAVEALHQSPLKGGTEHYEAGWDDAVDYALALLSAGDKAEAPTHRMGPPAWEPGLAHDEWANRCVTCHELWPCATSKAGDKAKAPR